MRDIVGARVVRRSAGGAAGGLSGRWAEARARVALVGVGGLAEWHLAAVVRTGAEGTPRDRAPGHSVAGGSRLRRATSPRQ